MRYLARSGFRERTNARDQRFKDAEEEVARLEYYLTVGQSPQHQPPVKHQESAEQHYLAEYVQNHSLPADLLNWDPDELRGLTVADAVDHLAIPKNKALRLICKIRGPSSSKINNT